MLENQRAFPKSDFIESDKAGLLQIQLSGKFTSKFNLHVTHKPRSQSYAQLDLVLTIRICTMIFDVI